MSNCRLVGALFFVFAIACSSKGTKTTSGAGGSSGAGGGATGSGGSTGSGTGGSTTAGGNSVLERGNHPSRDAHFIQPALTKAAAATMARDMAFTANFTGAMWASPLYFENGPGGKGVFFAVTTGNDVFALDETTGAMVWMHNIGTPAMANGVNCGSIHPLGIISTPVIDASTRTIYVAGAVGNTTAITAHQVHALSIDDGSERAGWPVDVTAKVGFTAPAANQRSALSLVNGIVYVAYGGHVGDCGDYHGRVVAIKASDPTQVAGWATAGQGEAIWAAGGMASDGTNLFAATGNRTGGGGGAHQDSEQVVRLTGMAGFTRSDQNLFYPSTWQTMDSSDADLGANNPVYLPLAGATPAAYVVAIAKDGHMYMLDSTNLGGMGKPVVDFMVAMPTGNMSMLIRSTAPAAYTTAMGTHVAFSTNTGAICPTGSMQAGREAIVSVLIPAGAPPAPQVAWCAALAGPATAPITTTTDGKSEAIVWYMNNGRLSGVDGDTGASIFNGTDNCAGVRQWTSPIAVKGRIVAGGDGHLCSWSPQ